MQWHYKCPWNSCPSLGGSTASWPLITRLSQGTAMLDAQTQFPNWSELVPGWEQTQHSRIPCLKFGAWWRVTPLTEAGDRIWKLVTEEKGVPRRKKNEANTPREMVMSSEVAPGRALCPNSPSSRGQTACLTPHGLLLFRPSSEFMRPPCSFLMHSVPL